MQRRGIIKGLLAGAATLAAPAIAAAPGSRVLKFVPQTDLTVLDPIWTTAYVTRNHGYLVYDTLYGLDANYRPQPQMLEGHSIENDGRLWKLTLREGLKFHTGEAVLARDAVASIRRWAARDMFGQTVMAMTEELSATSDRVIEFRLKQPFPLLADALGKSQTNMPCIMPERLAQTDPAKQVAEIVGSGPYRFVAGERVSGSRYVYQRFEDYVPRAGDAPSFTAGPKRANFDRVEWQVIPDAATAAAALQNGEVDWWEQPTADLQPLLKRNPNLRVEVTDRTGLIGDFRPNHLLPPFDNPAIRRAILGGFKQADFMQAVVGPDPSMYSDRVGVFCPGTPFASDAGLEVLTGPRDYAKVQKDLAAAGYAGEKVVLLAGVDYPNLNAVCEVAGDMLRRCGLNVDYQSISWGTVQQRRNSREPIDKGGWNCFLAFGAGLDYFSPAGIVPLRANGRDAWVGWPTSPRLEDLRTAWFNAPDPETQKKICREIQHQVWQDVPYIPFGQFLQPTAYRSDLTGLLQGFAQFHSVRRI